MPALLIWIVSKSLVTQFLGFFIKLCETRAIRLLVSTLFHSLTGHFLTFLFAQFHNNFASFRNAPLVTDIIRK